MPNMSPHWPIVCSRLPPSPDRQAERAQAAEEEQAQTLDRGEPPPSG
ncbi:hypothetical protein N8J89_25805 [Crossiella sp. CA-258035]|nr:hypothetical protein [Crossiella sp. CA-258035]WHT16542.1 hypothetical protein N8J89_25805 [Crossiella sp. CA-258035]